MSTTSPLSPVTANDRFKRSFGAWLWGGVGLSTLLHFAALSLAPGLAVDGLGRDDPDHIVDLEPPPPIEVPPAPQPLPEPAIPVPGDAGLEAEPSLEPRAPDVPDVPLRPPRPRPDTAGAFGVPYEVAPELLDPARARAIVEAEYPASYERAGIGGAVVVWALVGTDGTVRRARVARSSGHPPLDSAAVRALRRFEFRPALSRDRRVAVWIRQRISFSLR